MFVSYLELFFLFTNVCVHFLKIFIQSALCEIQDSVCMSHTEFARF